LREFISWFALVRELHLRPAEAAMTHNEGTVDRFIRIVLGLALLSLVFVGPHTWFGLLGLIPLATGVVGFCPLYRVFGLHTCVVKP
jgi:hypothetical protein